MNGMGCSSVREYMGIARQDRTGLNTRKGLSIESIIPTAPLNSVAITKSQITIASRKPRDKKEKKKEKAFFLLFFLKKKRR